MLNKSAPKKIRSPHSILRSPNSANQLPGLEIKTSRSSRSSLVLAFGRSMAASPMSSMSMKKSKTRRVRFMEDTPEEQQEAGFSSRVLEHIVFPKVCGIQLQDRWVEEGSRFFVFEIWWRLLIRSCDVIAQNFIFTKKLPASYALHALPRFMHAQTHACRFSS